MAVDAAVHIDLAKPGLVPAKVKVRHKSGKVFERTVMVRPEQAKAMKRKAGKGKTPTLSTSGLKVTAEQTAVLNELAKIPKEQRPPGWDQLVRALADPRHGGRLGPEKRQLMHAIAKAAPAGSPLRAAAARALQADAATPAERKAKAQKSKPPAQPKAKAQAKGKQKPASAADIKRWNAQPDAQRLAKMRAGKAPKLPKGHMIHEDGSVGPKRRAQLAGQPTMVLDLAGTRLDESAESEAERRRLVAAWAEQSGWV